MIDQGSDADVQNQAAQQRKAHHGQDSHFGTRIEVVESSGGKRSINQARCRIAWMMAGDLLQGGYRELASPNESITHLDKE